MICRGSAVLDADLIMWRSDGSFREFLHPARGGVVLLRLADAGVETPRLLCCTPLTRGFSGQYPLCRKKKALCSAHYPLSLKEGRKRSIQGMDSGPPPRNDTLAPPTKWFPARRGMNLFSAIRPHDSANRRKAVASATVYRDQVYRENDFRRFEPPAGRDRVKSLRG